MRLVWVSLSDLKPGLQFRETRALGTGWGPPLRALGACPCPGGRAAVSGAEGWSWAGEKEKKWRDGGSLKPGVRGLLRQESAILWTGQYLS